MPRQFTTMDHYTLSRHTRSVNGRYSVSTIDDLYGGAVGLLLVLGFAVKAATDLIFIATNTSGVYLWAKNVFFIAAILFALPALVGRCELRFKREFEWLLLVFVLFSFLSMVQGAAQGILSIKVLFELIKLALAPACAFCLLNTADEEQIDRFMRTVLVLAWVGYIGELTIKGVSIDSILNADYASSSSDTESSAFGGVCLGLCFYFAYKGERKLPLLASIALTVLTFKRLQIIYCIISIFISIFIKKKNDIQVSIPVVVIIALSNTALVLLWVWLLLPEQASFFYNTFGESQSFFTMGRSDILNYFIGDNFNSYGFKSASDVAESVFGYDLEMDCGEILIEFGLLGLSSFCLCMWMASRGSVWGCFIMSYIMLNSVLSRILTSSFTLIVMYIVIGLASIHVYENTHNKSATSQIDRRSKISKMNQSLDYCQVEGNK